MTRKDDRLRVAVTAKVVVPHVLRPAVVDKSTGVEDALLSRNLLLGKEDRAELDLALSLEDRSRVLEVRVTDMLTGTVLTK